MIAIFKNKTKFCCSFRLDESGVVVVGFPPIPFGSFGAGGLGGTRDIGCQGLKSKATKPIFFPASSSASESIGGC